MELIITKNGHIQSRFRVEDSDISLYKMEIVSDETIPAYPVEEAGIGKRWVLDYENNQLTWIKKDRNLTMEEEVELLKQQLEAAKIIMGVE